MTSKFESFFENSLELSIVLLKYFLLACIISPIVILVIASLILMMIGCFFSLVF